MTTPSDLIVYSVTEAAIAEMQQVYLPLVVKDLDDKKGYDACKKARLEVRGYRVAVDKQRKEFKKDALEYGRMVQLKANAIIDPLEAIEKHLRAEQDKIDGHAARVKAEEDSKRNELVLLRSSELLKYRSTQYVSPEQLAAMDDWDWQELFSKVKDDYFVRQKKKEEADAELERLRKKDIEDNAEIEKQREENRELQAKLIKKQEEACAEKAEEKAKADRKILADKQAQEEKERVEREKVAKEKAAQEERERIARVKVADEKLFDDIKQNFPTLEQAWLEIARLHKMRIQAGQLEKESVI